MAVLILILVVLTFGISIASRYHGPTPTRDGVDLGPEDGVGSETGREHHISGPPRAVAIPPADRPEV
ncbi:MAG: hypothetical protein KC729_18410, partial [Candidatus Eisenbacteria bacterium]|nr:hypothetical protein [Candidatus Eisenbacteria bacterium]